MDDVLLCILICLGSLFLGGLFGSAATDSAWINDCKKMSAHRADSLVVKCEIQKGTP